MVISIYIFGTYIPFHRVLDLSAEPAIYRVRTYFNELYTLGQYIYIIDSCIHIYNHGQTSNNPALDADSMPYRPICIPLITLT